MGCYVVSFVLLEAGFLTVTIRHSLLKDGVYFYYRRIPDDLRGHYGGKRHIRKSLKTSQAHIAAQKIAALASADDVLWASWRSPQAKEVGVTSQENRRAAIALLDRLGLAPGDAHRSKLDGHHAEVLDDYFEGRYGEKYMEVRHSPYYAEGDDERLFTVVEREAVRLVMEEPGKRRVLLTDALEAYLKSHPKGQQEKFARDTRRAIQGAIAAVNDLPLEAYKREQANSVRDHLLATGIKTATVRRELNRIKAVFNVGLTEFDLSGVKNPFEKLRIANEDHDAKTRDPFTTQELQAISRACHEWNDDIRHIIALQADTGARLGEIVGLRIEDVVLDHATPHIHIRPHVKLGRTLKTDTSERKVPLVGVALWAAQEAVKANRMAGGKKGWLFPRYASDGSIKATHASNSINKWLQSVTKTGKTSHSFRHTMRDRLRYAGTPHDIQDVIGGWGTKTVGMGYGQGYRLEQLKGWLDKVV
jgi:integrase